MTPVVDCCARSASSNRVSTHSIICHDVNTHVHVVDDIVATWRPCRTSKQATGDTQIRINASIVIITVVIMRFLGLLIDRYHNGHYKQVWQTGVIPPDLKKEIILPIYNGKGSPKDCKKLQEHITPINTRESICYGSAE